MEAGAGKNERDIMWIESGIQDVELGLCISKHLFESADIIEGWAAGFSANDQVTFED